MQISSAKWSEFIMEVTMKTKLEILKLATEREQVINDVLDLVMDVDYEGPFMLNVRSALANPDASRLSAAEVLQLASAYEHLIDQLKLANELDFKIARLQMKEE